MTKAREKFTLDARCRSRIGQGSGYTAVELTVVIALVAIVTMAALPHFSALVDRWRVQHVISQLQHVMRFAHAQAIRTGSYVTVLAKPADCRSMQNKRNWSCGLTVFQDIHNTKVQDTAGSTLQEVQEFRALTVIHAALKGQEAFLTYEPHGTLIANSSRFEVYPANHPDSPATQTICLSSGGRMRVTTGVKC